MSNEAQISRAIEWWIWQLKGVGNATMSRLAEAIDGDFRGLADESSATLDALLSELSIKSSVRARIVPKGLRRAVEVYEREQSCLPPDTRIVHRTDADYPTRFNILGRPPRFLYVRGHIAPLHAGSSLAVVGSRKARVDAIRQTRGMTEAVGRAGHIIVSGGAKGVDAAAHRGAIEADAETVVVLPSAVDKPTPARNRHIFDAALERGCLVSEYPLGTEARRYYFHRRNRLIAALANWVLVVRAGKHSGTMITARAAAELGCPIMTVLGDVSQPLFAGCAELMAAGAACVRDSDDILRLLGDAPESRGQVDRERIEENPPRKKTKPTAASTATVDPDVRKQLGEGAKKVVRVFEESGPAAVIHLDKLRRESGAAAVGLETALLELELAGIIEKVPGKNAYRLAK